MKRRRRIFAAILALLIAGVAVGAVTVVQAVLHDRTYVESAAAAPGPQALPVRPAIISVIIRQQPRRLMPPVQVPPAQLIASMQFPLLVTPEEPRTTISRTRLFLYSATALTTMLALMGLLPKRLHLTRR